MLAVAFKYLKCILKDSSYTKCYMILWESTVHIIVWFVKISTNPVDRAIICKSRWLDTWRMAASCPECRLSDTGGNVWGIIRDAAAQSSKSVDGRRQETTSEISTDWYFTLSARIEESNSWRWVSAPCKQTRQTSAEIRYLLIKCYILNKSIFFFNKQCDWKVLG